STPKLVDNKIRNSRIGIALYVKKPEFGPPKAELRGNQLSGNKKDISVDDGGLVTAYLGN
ncbi:MAG: hypothetical protein QGF59_05100, partial [Pirellulaceae bacterium]|nr:hypothetical protein [Pirellulaceae bacterium]